MEGMTINVRDNVPYIAMSRIESSMLNGSTIHSKWRPTVDPIPREQSWSYATCMSGSMRAERSYTLKAVSERSAISASFRAAPPLPLG